MSSQPDYNAVLGFLRQFVTSRSGARGLLDVDELGPFQRLLVERTYFEPNLPRLLLVGEFKAGKSTLLNALVEQKVSATDVFEMTSWVARYWPSREPFCRVALRDGTEYLTASADFLRRCQERRFSATELQAIDAVDIGVVHPAVNAAFIDAPGFGAVTTANEQRLSRAIEEADVILWVLDAESLGSVRESAMAAALAKSGLPIIVALNKCDLVSAAERAEVLAFAGRQFAISADDVFAVSALEATKERSEASGVPALRRQISRAAVRQASLRRDAEVAHAKRLREHALDLVQRIEARLDTASGSVSRFATIANQMALGTQEKLEAQIEAYIRENFYGNKETAIAGELATAMRQGGGALAPETINGIFQRHLGSAHLDAFWKRVNADVAGHAGKAWAERLGAMSEEVDAMCAELRARVAIDLGPVLDPHGVEVMAAAVYEQTFGDAAASALQVAALATAFAAWIGPSAAATSLGAAATGVGIPIALAGLGLAWFLAHHKRHQAQSQLPELAKAALAEYVEEFIRKVIRPDYFPKLREINHRIAASLVERFEAGVVTHLPAGGLPELIEGARATRRTLEAAT